MSEEYTDEEREELRRRRLAQMQRGRLGVHQNHEPLLISPDMFDCSQTGIVCRYDQHRLQ